MSATLKTSHLTQLATDARESGKSRKFPQSLELIVTLKDIDSKKQDSILNETVFLPNQFSSRQKICAFASGDLAVRAKKSEIDRVIEPEELDSLAEKKRDARKIARGYQVFLAQTDLMPKIGKVLGPFLGPRGRMPTPVPPNAPLDALIARFASAVRVRSRGQLAAACKIGDDKMTDEQIGQNAEAVVSAIEKKLPSGADNIKTVFLKLSMGPPVKAKVQEAN